MSVPQNNLVASMANGEQWHTLIESIFGSVNMDLGNLEKFRGNIRRAVLGDIELNEVSTSYEDARRTARNIASDMQESFVLVMPLAGTLYLSQDNRECTVKPGSLAFFYLNSPHRYFHGEETRILDLKIPAPMLRCRLRHADRRSATVVAADRGVAKITLDFVASMADQLFKIPQTMAMAYIGRLVDTVALLIDCEPGGLQSGRSSLRQVIRSRCIATIETHIADPDLSPGLLARQCGISSRYVHAIFQDTGETVGEFIRNRRLSICHERLCRSAAGDLQIKDIALSVGFRSAAHFCNAFKAKYGITPSSLWGGQSAILS